MIVIRNRNISPESWIIQEQAPYYTAQVHEFKTDGEAKEFSIENGGVQVPGKNMILLFAGVATATRCPVDFDTAEQIPVVLAAMAQHLQIQ